VENHTKIRSREGLNEKNLQIVVMAMISFSVSNKLSHLWCHG